MGTSREGSCAERNEQGESMIEAQSNPSFSATMGAGIQQLTGKHQVSARSRGQQIRVALLQMGKDDLPDQDFRAAPYVLALGDHFAIGWVEVGTDGA